MRRLLLPCLLLTSTAALAAPRPLESLTTLLKQYQWLIAGAIVLVLLGAGLWFWFYFQILTPWFNNKLPLPAVTKGFIEIGDKNNSWLLSLHNIAKVQAKTAEQSVITLFTRDETGSREELIMPLPYKQLLQKIKQAASY